MPLKIPNLDDRRYQELLDEALARIPVHNPEWTNFNTSDPGVTLVEVFAFLTETVLYRANQVPERNRLKFLNLLGLPLHAAASARGLLTIANERGPLTTVTLGADLEVRASKVPFRTAGGLDVLPIEARCYYKRRIEDLPERIAGYYRKLYASHADPAQPNASAFRFYRTEPLFLAPGAPAVDLDQASDRALWIALSTRASDKPVDDALKTQVRAELAGKTLSLGLVPAAPTGGVTLPAGGVATAVPTTLTISLPQVAADGALPADGVPRYRALAHVELPDGPGVAEALLPAAAELVLWSGLDPLEPGVDSGDANLPPDLGDSTLDARLITWVRVTWPTGAPMRLLWAGINAVMVEQRAWVRGEQLPAGTGEPDQQARLSRPPVVPETLTVTVTTGTGGDASAVWTRLDDVMTAGPEVRTGDARLPPGAAVGVQPPARSYQLDAESGLITFGDGARGMRPPPGAVIRADYAYSAGADGNVGHGSINAAPGLPAGFAVGNPVPTWGGTASEDARGAEKRIARFLQHRERPVTADDFAAIARRTPGVDVRRVDVLPCYHPDLGSHEPGDVPGVVTLMLVPAFDALHPLTPEPTPEFLAAVGRWIDRRRLVTTEVILRGPTYVELWAAIAISVVPGYAQATVRVAVQAELQRFLSPLPLQGAEDDGAAVATARGQEPRARGWPLRKPVIALELLAVASRVPGVQFIKQVVLARSDGQLVDALPLGGLELPRLVGLAVVADNATAALSAMTGDAATVESPFVAVPVVPETC